MQLTKQHIQSLYEFTKKHFVEWYDLQTELVDHLANDIENIWSENPNLSFEEARNKSFKKFGVMGFSNVVEKRQNALYKKYWLLLWKFFKDYFKLPKIVLTVLLITLTFLLLKNVQFKEIILIIYFFILIILTFLFVFSSIKKIKRKEKATGKKWLFEHIIGMLGGFGSITIALVQLFYYIGKIITINYWGQWLISAFFVIFGIFLFIAIKIIPKKMTEYMLKNYPEYQSIT